MKQLTPDKANLLMRICKEINFNHYFFLQLILNIRKVGFFEMAKEKDITLVDELRKHFGLNYMIKHIKYVDTYRVTIDNNSNSDDSLYEIYIGLKKEDVIKAFENYPSNKLIKTPLGENVITAGEIFGYPKCCIEHFHKLEKLKVSKIIFDSYKKSKSFEFNRYLNIIWIGQRYISHIPCTFNCTESIKFAEKVKEYSDGSELTGDFIYFYDNNTIKINSTHKEGNLILYHGASVIKNKISNEERKILRILNYGDAISINKNLEIYKNNKKIYTLGGMNEYWIYMRFV